MDVLSFDPTQGQNTDSTYEVEGYQEHVEDIQQAYPEQDWTNPAELEEQMEQQREFTPVAHEQEGQPTEREVTPVAHEQPQTTEQKVDPKSVNRFSEYVDPTTGQIPLDVLRQAGYDEGLIRMARAQYDYTPEEKQMWEEFDANGGHNNLENVYNTVMKIRNSQTLLDRYDRNGDGQFTISDWYDMERYNAEAGITPEEEIRDTDKWLRDLANGHLGQRVAAAFGHEPMARYIHQKRKGMLGPEDQLEGEQARASWLGGLAVTTEAVLWPTPGSFSSSSKLSGTFPLCFIISSFDSK